MLVGISGYVGFLLGKQTLAVEFRNYKPTIVLNREAAQPKEVDFSMFWLVWDKLARSYVDKTAINSQKMVEGAIAGMVAALGDPYTVYLPKKANRYSLVMVIMRVAEIDPDRPISLEPGMIYGTS